MIQELDEIKLDNQYKNFEPEGLSSIIAFHGRGILLGENEGISYPTYAEVMACTEMEGQRAAECRYLFSIGEQRYFLWQGEELELKGYHYVDLFPFRSRRPQDLLFAGATAWHLDQWYRSNRFCGVCGSSMEHSEKERMLHCPKCNHMVYPRIAPAVIVGVTDDTRLLMTKYVGREYTRYALIAGFTEIGETVEETVIREVEEEVGLKVKKVSYYKSQPWGFDGLLLMGFFAEVEDPTAPICLDETELSVAHWVEGAEIKEEPEQISLTGEMMQQFRAWAIRQK